MELFNRLRLFSFSSIFFKNIRVFDNKHLDLFLRRINQEMIKQNNHILKIQSPYVVFL